ncbi:radical SAM protein [Photobacterium damselae]|uniref:radical SAM protein n=1 Tax=Photobacterium damselae TaxID=38293 RepID=UPI001302C111|nr:radical SAM protein [Photobacterium damselae]MCG3844246.1 radical SAM protein [Photobacterium damselae]
MHNVFCISAGQLDIKKEPNIINKKNLYLNYGLLSLASILKRNGLNPIQIHGNFTSPKLFSEHCINLGIDKTQYPVLISIPSFYAINWVHEFTKILKEEVKIKNIIVGGRWVIDGEVDQLKELLPFVDTIVDGLGEKSIFDIFNISQFNRQTYSKLDYNILEDRELYQPSIEVSRGCGMGCDFCQEKDEKLLPLKSPQNIVLESNNIILHDKLNPMSLYFEASHFKPTEEWLLDLINQRELYRQTFKWRSESRADSNLTKFIPKLKESGMKVLDLGLESASAIQLERMKKTKKPETYLEKASSLLEAAYQHDIDVKVNVLLYAGETQQTIDDTYKWLDQHRRYIKGVSVGPVIAFGWDNKKIDFIKELESSGASIDHTEQLVGITNFNLSKNISANKARELSKEISQDFMSAKDYYDLKSFSYFPRYYTYDDFISDIKQENGNYSFDITGI